jgi:hypothetical protein
LVPARRSPISSQSARQSRKSSPRENAFELEDLGIGGEIQQPPAKKPMRDGTTKLCPRE